MIPDAETFGALQARMHVAAQAVRLPLRQQVWRGGNGHWNGSGTGSSLDFQDHRPYYPGDDPRQIDWQAYARSGHYTMKLYREEVSPSVDLVLDTSASLFLTPAKALRTLELYAFALSSAAQLRGNLRCFLLTGATVTPLPTEAGLDRERLAAAVRPEPGRPALEQVPWRSGSLRIWISDFLFPGAPHLGPLAGGKGVVFVPWCREEAEPEWAGNLEMHDCETGERRVRRLNPAVLKEYRAAYQRHFQLWQAEARRCGVALARVGAEPPFLEALKPEAFPHGAVEPA